MTTASLKPAARRAPRRLSPSAIEKYRSCPRAFAYHYIEKAAGEDRPSGALVTGSAVHAALDKFFGLPAEDRQVTNLHQALRAVWAQNRTEGAFLDVDDEAEAGRGALDMLTRYAEQTDLLARPRIREDWGRLTLPNGIHLFGKIDRVDVSAEGDVTVIDYKTGRRAITQAEVPTNVAAQIYTLAIAERFNGSPITFRLEYLALGRHISWSPTPEDLASARRRMVELTDEIGRADLDNGDFKATPGPACGVCDYAHICEDKDKVTLDDLAVTEAVPF